MIDHNSIIFLTGIIISCIYFISIKSKILRNNVKLESLEKGKKISIIIPARNEQDNIRKLLIKLLNQTVRIDEIIVVNDNSGDNTLKVVLELSKTY